MKLGHYYSLAMLNHFNIIVTGKHLQISLLETFLTIMDPTVCHPALHLSWFRLINNDSYCWNIWDVGLMFNAKAGCFSSKATTVPGETR